MRTSEYRAGPCLIIDHVEMCSTEPAGGVQIRTDVLKEVLQHHHVNSPLSLFNNTFSVLWLFPNPQVP